MRWSSASKDKEGQLKERGLNIWKNFEQYSTGGSCSGIQYSLSKLTFSYKGLEKVKETRQMKDMNRKFFKRLCRAQTPFFLNVLMLALNESTPSLLAVCDSPHLLCTVHFEKKDAKLLTNYLYVWTIAFCLF